MRGAREIGFTVLSMSTSLVAVFIPILLMSGIVGRLFREFAVTLSLAILVSLFVSLTATPMMCAQFLKSSRETTHGRVYRFAEGVFDGVVVVVGVVVVIGVVVVVRGVVVVVGVLVVVGVVVVVVVVVVGGLPCVIVTVPPLWMLTVLATTSPWTFRLCRESSNAGA